MKHGSPLPTPRAPGGRLVGTRLLELRAETLTPVQGNVDYGRGCHIALGTEGWWVVSTLLNSGGNRPTYGSFFCVHLYTGYHGGLEDTQPHLE